MAYSQVRDLIKHIGRFHADLRNLYESIGEAESDERLTMLLKYMGRHEANINQALNQYDQQAAEGLLNTWLQFTSEQELKKLLDHAWDEVREETNGDNTAEELIATAAEVDQQLIEFYKQGRDESNVPRVQEFFTSLLEMAEGKEHDYAKSILGMQDL